MHRPSAPLTLLLRAQPRRGGRPPCELLDLRGRCIRRFPSVEAALRYLRRRRHEHTIPGEEP